MNETVFKSPKEIGEVIAVEIPRIGGKEKLPLICLSAGHSSLPVLAALEEWASGAQKHPGRPDHHRQLDFPASALKDMPQTRFYFDAETCILKDPVLTFGERKTRL